MEWKSVAVYIVAECYNRVSAISWKYFFLLSLALCLLIFWVEVFYGLFFCFRNFHVRKKKTKE